MLKLLLAGNLALAMGPHTKPNIPHLLPCVLGALGDSKPNVRAAAISTLNTFMKETSMRDMFVSDIFGTVLWKALEMLVGFVESDFEALFANLDLLLKWMTLRFFETNSSVNIKGLEYLTLLFTVLSECDDGYNLHEIEATSFIPYIITKIGNI